MWKWQFLLSLIKYFSGDEQTLFRRLRGLQSLLAEEFNTLDLGWTSTIARAKRPETYQPLLVNETPAAVVMQGALRLEDDFTLETVKYYRQVMPGASIIVSTWNDQDSAALAAIEQAGAAVVTNPHPEYAGSGNVNRQIRTTVAGLEVARQQGFELTLKTRTDARIYAYHVLDYLAGLMRSFPLRIETPQRARIVILDYATRLLIPNHPADMLMFGQTSDLTAFWSCPENYGPERNRCSENLGVHWSEKTPEVYVCENYLRRIGYPFERTIASWWRTLVELFVIADRDTIDHFWPKYGYAQEHRDPANEPVRTFAICTFRDWINLFTHPKQLALSDERLKELWCDQLLEAA
jgi:hypothetical protein